LVLQFGAGVLALLALTALRFLSVLYQSPGAIVASWNYSQLRLHALWRHLSVRRLRLLATGVTLLTALAFVEIAQRLLARGHYGLMATVAIGALLAASLWWFGVRFREPAPVAAVPRRNGRMNILMIGSDTLRADRLGVSGYYRSLTPFIDDIARSGTLFSRHYVPCARTAPSLASLFSGCWPHTHGIRDNFVSRQEAEIRLPMLPALLRDAGYTTSAVGDWAAGDLRKFGFGFERIDSSDDQWNLKYLLKQGPKDLRLFLLLWLSNRLGKWLVPAVYYLAGVPRTRHVGVEVRRELSRLALDEQPFLLTAFMAATHPPFTSEAPYYTLFADPNYRGESMFAMARLTDPFEIIRRQGEPRKEFDLDQIEDLYDGCVRSFDDEVGRILAHLKQCGLAENTIVVIFSDHGMEFFEHGTWGQGNSVLTEASSRTPLVVVDPRRSGAGASERVVRSIDVAPTLLDLAGLPVPSSMNGGSLRPYLEDPSADLALAACNETGLWLTELPGMRPDHLRYPGLLDLLDVPDERSGTLAIKEEYRAAIVAAKDRMVRRGRWKLVAQPTTHGLAWSLFDVEVDPACRHDVASRHPEVVEELKQFLLDWMGSGPAASTAKVGDELIAPAPTRPAPAVG
jgi:arylsulfatase A-like enzyme